MSLLYICVTCALSRRFDGHHSSFKTALLQKPSVRQCMPLQSVCFCFPCVGFWGSGVRLAACLLCHTSAEDHVRFNPGGWGTAHGAHSVHKFGRFGPHNQR